MFPSLGSRANLQMREKRSQETLQERDVPKSLNTSRLVQDIILRIMKFHFLPGAGGCATICRNVGRHSEGSCWQNFTDQVSISLLIAMWRLIFKMLLQRLMFCHRFDLCKIFHWTIMSISNRIIFFGSHKSPSDWFHWWDTVFPKRLNDDQNGIQVFMQINLSGVTITSPFSCQNTYFYSW